jgi:hypothetical protein
MKFAQALDQLSRYNVNLASLTEESLEGLVYGKGVSTETLIAMHQAADVLKPARRFQAAAGPLATETEAALNLRALHGDVAARKYLREVSA